MQKMIKIFAEFYDDNDIFKSSSAKTPGDSFGVRVTKAPSPEKITRQSKFLQKLMMAITNPSHHQLNALGTVLGCKICSLYWIGSGSVPGQVVEMDPVGWGSGVTG